MCIRDSGWYSSGDDDNPYNGSERMPMFNSQWPVTPLGFGGCYTDLSPWKVLGHGGGCGLTGGVAYLKNVSFIDRLKHTLKVSHHARLRDRIESRVQP